MRNLLIAFFLILALNIHVHAQKRAIHNNTYKEIKWGQKDHYHDFQFLFIDGEPQLSDSTTKSLALDFLQSISLYNIIDREKEINYLYQNRLSFSHSDTLLLLNTYRVYALQQYVEKQYNKSIQGFEAYFRLYESYFHSNIYPGFEFTKYTVCFKKKRDYKRFIQLLESEIKKVENIGEYNSYQAQYLIESGKHFSNQRQLDTARHILSKAKLLLSDKKKEEFYIKSNLFKQLGYLELFSSNIELAINYFNIAIDNLLETKHSNVQMANLYNDLAKAYYIDNQLKKADSYFSMALAIYELELRPNHSVIINTYRYLGLINYGLSDYTNAIAYLKKSISLDPAPKRYLSYRNLAEVYAKTDSIELAQKYYALSLKNTIITQGENSYQSAISYLAYGEFLLLKTPFTQKGEDYIAKTIELEYEIFQEKSIDFIEPLNILGKYYIQDGQINRGLDSLQSALIQAIENFHSRDIYTNPQSEKSIRESSFTNTLAWKAYGFYLKYIETNYIEDLKMSLLTYNHFIYVAKETRKYFEETESVIDAGQLDYVFGQAIDIGNQLYQITGERKYLEQVFRFIEGKKSYTLFTSLSILEKKRLLNIPKELLKKEQKLKYSLGLLNEKISIEQAIKRSNKIIDLEKNAFTITQSLDSIQKIYKEQYSGFYNLKYGFNELSLSEIEEKTKENQAFLNYALSDSLLTFICINNTGSHLFYKRIDSIFYNKIRTSIKLLQKVHTDESYNEFHEYIDASRYLYKLLIEPTQDHIKNKELIIVPDGILNYISFDALLMRDVNLERPDYSKLPYLIKNHKSNIANSMQIYFNMKNRELRGNKQVYAFAPEYTNDLDTNKTASYQFLRPLNFSTLEVEQIKNYFPSSLFIGERATKANFVKNAKDASILHLAMHTFVDDENPMYSKLLFTYDTATQEGLLNTYELLNLELNAELAVLSACNSGDGELHKGEGVMSLSSGFQYAGVPAIVMSLWEVNDRFGSMVIANFYKYLSQGYAKNTALHKAKMEVLKQGNALYAHPYYWSGLSLLGEDAPISFYKRTSYFYFILIGLLFSLSIFILILWKRRKS